VRTKAFVNLPAKDRSDAMDCLKAFGRTFNPPFTDETAARLVISEDIYDLDGQEILCMDPAHLQPYA
jgi:predicted lactoylglutathione lyase